MVRIPIIQVKNTTSVATAFIGSVTDDELYINAQGKICCLVGHRFMEGEPELEIKYFDPTELFLYIPTVMLAQEGEKNILQRELLDYYRLKIAQDIDTYKKLLLEDFDDEAVDDMGEEADRVIKESIIKNEESLRLTQRQVLLFREITESVMKSRYKGGFATRTAQELFCDDVLETLEELKNKRFISKKYKEDISAIIEFLKFNSETIIEMLSKRI